jgi:hypothetical protein
LALTSRTTTSRVQTGPSPEWPQDEFRTATQDPILSAFLNPFQERFLISFLSATQEEFQNGLLFQFLDLTQIPFQDAFQLLLLVPFREEFCNASLDEFLIPLPDELPNPIQELFLRTFPKKPQSRGLPVADSASRGAERHDQGARVESRSTGCSTVSPERSRIGHAPGIRNVSLRARGFSHCGLPRVSRFVLRTSLQRPD